MIGILENELSLMTWMVGRPYIARLINDARQVKTFLATIKIQILTGNTRKLSWVLVVGKTRCMFKIHPRRHIAE